jgi:hypothetical protein
MGQVAHYRLPLRFTLARDFPVSGAYRKNGISIVVIAEFPSLICDSEPVIDAAEAGIIYVEAGIEHSFRLGKGSGPLNHFHNITQRLIPL